MSATALETVGFIPLVGEEVLHGREEKRAEPATGAIRLRDKVFLQEPREEGLREILRVMGSPALPPQERVERIPVGRTQPLQRRRCFRRGIAARREHDAPVRRAKVPRLVF